MTSTFEWDIFRLWNSANRVLYLFSTTGDFSFFSSSRVLLHAFPSKLNFYFLPNWHNCSFLYHFQWRISSFNGIRILAWNRLYFSTHRIGKISHISMCEYLIWIIQFWIANEFYMRIFIHNSSFDLLVHLISI